MKYNSSGYYLRLLSPKKGKKTKKKLFPQSLRLNKGCDPNFCENVLSLLKTVLPPPPLSIFSPDFPKTLDTNKEGFENLGGGG